MPHHIIGTCIVRPVKPYQLVAALMAREGMGPLPLAKKINKPALQPQIHRFVRGEVLEPSPSTAVPLATYFGLPLEAMYDEKAATAVARERGVTELPPEAMPIKKRRKVVAQAFDEDVMQVAALYAELSPEERQRFRALLSPPQEGAHPSIDLSVRMARLVTIISTTPADQRLQALINAEAAVWDVLTGTGEVARALEEAQTKLPPTGKHPPGEGTQPR